MWVKNLDGNYMIWLIIGGSVLTIGDIFFKFWTKNPHNWMYVVGLSIYLIGLMFLVQSFKNTNIAVASAIFVVANIITLTIVSWLFFNEPLSIIKIIGLLLAIVSILILEI